MKFSLLAALLITTWAGYVILLAFVPWYLPPPADLPNVASVLGYNINLAYILIVVWTAVMGLMTAFVMRSAAVYQTNNANQYAVPSVARLWTERGVVALGALIFYWPGALKRFGPHVEDVYFLNVLWREACGAVPYRDFEFLYGPLMLAPANAAMNLLGFSMTTYFTYLAVIQVVFFVVLIGILQRYIAQALARYLAFLLLLPFVLDLLYGLNWIAWRYFGVIIALLILSARPKSFRAIVGAGAIIGLQSAYSHEYGIAGLLSGIAVIVLGLFEPGRGRSLKLSMAFVTSALATWAAVVAFLTGENLSAYVEATLLVMADASKKGLGQFAFYWTVHSLALFALLTSIVVLGGIGLSRLGRISAAEGDRQIIGALVFSIVVLKVSFQRVDFLHLAVPFVPLALVLLLNAERKLLSANRLLQRISVIAIAVAAIAHTVGHIPQGRWVMLGLARGILHEVQNRPLADVPADARGGILGERSEPKPIPETLASRLASADLKGRPVLFYGRIWSMAVETGACPAGYSFYDLLYTNERAPLAELKNTTPDVLIALHSYDAATLIEGAPLKTAEPLVLTGFKKAIRMIASPHYEQSYLEHDIETKMWTEALGNTLAVDYRVIEQVGDIVLLELNQ